MSDRLLIIFSMLSAMMLALAYRPMLIRMSLGLASPYSKADTTKRLLAAIFDILLVVTLLAAYRSSKSLLDLAIALAYLLMHDAILGRSAGKFLCGLVVINLETGLPCGWKQSIRRNLLFLLPGANAVAAFLEAKTCIQDPQGQRLGDRIALTQVVEGFGVKDLVGALQKWWQNFPAVLDLHSPRPDRVPVRVPRCGRARLPSDPNIWGFGLTAVAEGSDRCKIAGVHLWKLPNPLGLVWKLRQFVTQLPVFRTIVPKPIGTICRSKFSPALRPIDF